MSQWIEYLIYAILIWFILSRFLPVRGLQNLSASDVEERLKNKQDYTFVDVREVNEYQSGHIKGFHNIPLSQLRGRVGEIDATKQVVLTCRSGMRSRQAAKVLRKHGIRNISHLKTGVSGWNGKLVK